MSREQLAETTVAGQAVNSSDSSDAELDSQTVILPASRTPMKTLMALSLKAASLLRLSGMCPCSLEAAA